jgi:hypothetical protein
VQAYSQKQLSDVSVRIDELSRFITTPILSQLAQAKGGSPTNPSGFVKLTRSAVDSKL